jgi:hypothetical protein
MTATVGNNSYTAALANDNGIDLAGANSGHTSDNKIYVKGSADDHDVIVLSTGVESNDRIIWENTGNGKVTVVNFDAAITASTPSSGSTGSPASFTLDLGDAGDTFATAGDLFVSIPGLDNGAVISLLNITAAGNKIGGISAIGTDGMATALASTFGGSWITPSFSHIALGQITWTSDTNAACSGIEAMAASVSSANFGGLAPSDPASVGATSVQGVDDVAPGVAIVNDLGRDILDFTSYRVGWLGVAELDIDGRVNPSGGWTIVDPDAYDAAAVGNLVATIASDAQYITLTRAYDAGTHTTTLYEARLWTVKGGDDTADAFTATSDDTSVLIGYVDVGHLLDGNNTTDAAAANIVF